MTRSLGKPDGKPSHEELSQLQSALRARLHLILERDPKERIAAMIRSMASRSAEAEVMDAPRKQLFPQPFLQKL